MLTSPIRQPPVRRLALQILCRVETSGAFADHLIARATAAHHLPDRGRAFLRELTYGVLRWRNYLDWLLGQCSDRPLASLTAQVRNLLRLGVYQLCMMERIPPHAAVSETVRLARQVEHAGTAAFIDAVLRAVARQRGAFGLPDATGDLVTYLTVVQSHPRWLMERWLARYGPQRTEEMCQANNQPPPLVVRVNRLRASREQLIEALGAEGCQVAVCAFAPEGVLMASHPPLAQLHCYRQGWFTVQDEAAMLCGRLLSPQPGERLLDACAAPGGKATHMAELMGDDGEVICLDQSHQRLRLLEENRRRLGLKSLHCLAGDATMAAFKGGFDRILVDAPCSGLGVLRRHPDAKWRKGPELIQAMAAQQVAMLTHLSHALKPGGVMVYVTCSTEPEENQGVIQTFLRERPDYQFEGPGDVLPPSAHRFVRDQRWFQTWPGSEGMDGFFGVRLRRRR